MFEGCVHVSVPLIIFCVAFILSVTCNLVFCIMKFKKGKKIKYHNQCTISYEQQQYVENNPIYGNLNQLIHEHNNEGCYVQMSHPYQRNTDDIVVVSEETMCYAALDLSPKNQKMSQKNAMAVNTQSCDLDISSMNREHLLSRSSIYLNTDQLKAEINNDDNLIHDDPIRLYNMIKKARQNVTTEDQSQAD
ncbi:Hypothetical predicted protein [Pelobates cultripes]|uniref:Uncharacterized protein n=1 Tax=Pelobates cultripes TaxID=61616 RepID=A0AAD1R198_PELCU|nr:Hypothetical predicted protein [Pelobates cultripes]